MKYKPTKADMVIIDKLINIGMLQSFEQHLEMIEKRTKLTIADIDNLITIGELDPDVCKEVWEFTQTSTTSDSYKRFVDKSWAEVTMPYPDDALIQAFKMAPGFDEFGNTELDYYGEGWDLILSFKGKDDINHLGDDRTHDWPDNLSYDKWTEFTDNLSDDDLILLFKGLVQVENVIQWNGRYKNADVFVYKVIRFGGLDKDNKIADFARYHCTNPDILFVKLKLATNTELRKKYTGASYKEKLELIANDEKYPPEYYPWEWTVVSDEEIAKLPEKLIEKLYERLIKTKGPHLWERLAVKVEKYDELRQKLNDGEILIKSKKDIWYTSLKEVKEMKPKYGMPLWVVSILEKRIKEIRSKKDKDSTKGYDD